MRLEQCRNNFDRFISALTKEEQERALGLCFEEDRVRSVLGAWMLHKAFSEDYPSEKYEITHNEYGKPYYPQRLLDKKHAYFNLSHSGDLVVLAKAEYDLGVDVEKVRQLDFGTFKSVFTDSEMKSIQQACLPQEEFFALWTKKEAFVKCIGKGISALDEFEENGSGYTYASRHCKGHIITVCSKHKINGVVIKTPEFFQGPC